MMNRAHRKHTHHCQWHTQPGMFQKLLYRLQHHSCHWPCRIFTLPNVKKWAAVCPAQSCSASHSWSRSDHARWESIIFHSASNGNTWNKGAVLVSCMTGKMIDEGLQSAAHDASFGEERINAYDTSTTIGDEHGSVLPHCRCKCLEYVQCTATITIPHRWISSVAVIAHLQHMTYDTGMVHLLQKIMSNQQYTIE